jgi:5'-AMP-activated protein kinase, regulatory beta subunit
MGNQQPGSGGPPPSGDDPRQQGRGGYGQGAAYMPTAASPSGGGGGGGAPHGYPGSHQGYASRGVDPHGGSVDPGGIMHRSGSDTSMTLLDGEKTAAAVAASAPGTSSAHATLEAWLDDDTVPTVFRWEHGGRQVYITGTFNGWSRQIPMHRSGNDFTYIHNLKRGKHAFKFIVDDEWRFAPDQPTVADIEGRINNFIDVTDFKPYTGDREFEREKAAAEYGVSGDDVGDGGADGTGAGTEPNSDGSDTMANKPDKDGETFSHNMPDLDDYTKEPPPLPPHLRHIILNKPPQLQDTAALPVPQHVALNHLYCTAIKDNMMVLGITQRFKTKFVTTVYYSPCASK